VQASFKIADEPRSTTLARELRVLARLALDPKSHRELAIEYYNRGIEIQDGGHHEEAISIFQGVSELDPTLKEAYLALGGSRGALGQPLDALVAYKKALTLDPRYYEAHVGLGAALGALARYPEALSELKAAMDISPETDAQAYFNAGLALIHLDQYAEAIFYLDVAIRIDPQYEMGHAFSLRGISRAKLGRYTEAKVDLETAAQLNPSSWEAHHNLGYVEMMLGHYREAIMSLDKAIKLDPTVAESYHDRGLAMERSGLPGAELYFEMARKLDKSGSGTPSSSTPPIASPIGSTPPVTPAPTSGSGASAAANKVIEFEAMGDGIADKSGSSDASAARIAAARSALSAYHLYSQSPAAQNRIINAVRMNSANVMFKPVVPR
jgi:tetratricopeptide (TPR) repeat protein